MNEFIGKNKFKLMILAVSLVMLLTAGSYAFFTAVVNGNEFSETTVVKSGVMEITFTDGQLIGTPSNMIPGQSIEKRFSVKNTGNVETSYVIYLSEIINTFNPSTDLEYKLEKLSSNGFNMDSFVVAPVNSSAINNVAQSIDVNEVQEYKLTVRFKEANANQDNNKGKKFQTKIQINEVSDATIAINLHSDVTLSSYTHIASIGRTLDLADPHNDDYLFLGWYLDSNYQNQLPSNTVVTESLTDLYAKWEVIATSFSSYLRNLDTSDVTQDDGTEDANMRYVGSSPNNYVSFKLGNNTYETWRVIGVFNSNTHGYSSDLVKIARDLDICLGD